MRTKTCTRRRTLRYLVIFSAVFAILAGLTSIAKAEAIPKSFVTSAKRITFDIFGVTSRTFYCGCYYNSNKDVDHSECGYRPINYGSDRSFSVEVDHVVTAYELGKNLACYGDERKEIEECTTSGGKLMTGRACCQKVNPLYKQAHNDMVNLIPVIGELNAKRRDNLFGVVDGEPRDFGMCDVEIADNTIEVAPELRGDIARKQLYMYMRYSSALKMDVDPELIEMIWKVHLSDPVTDPERVLNSRTCHAQGSGNPLVSSC